MAVVAISVFAGCGEDDGAVGVETAPVSVGATPPPIASPDPPEPTVVPTAAAGVGLEGLPEELATLTGVGIAQTLERGCVGWSFLEYRDSGAINDAVSQFLYNAPSPLLGQLAADRGAFDELVRTVCEQPDNPSRAWSMLAAHLAAQQREYDPHRAGVPEWMSVVNQTQSAKQRKGCGYARRHGV